MNYNVLNIELLLYPQIEISSAAAAAKSLQSCPTLCNPIDGSPPGSPVPGILQARVLEWGVTTFSEKSHLVTSNSIEGNKGKSLLSNFIEF